MLHFSRPSTLEEHHQRWIEALNTSSSPHGETPQATPFRVDPGVGMGSKILLSADKNPR